MIYANNNRKAVVDNSVYEAPKIRDVNDIKMVLKEFDPNNKINESSSVQISTKMRCATGGNDNRQQDLSISADVTACTHRSMVLEALGELLSRKRNCEKAADKYAKVERPIINGKVMSALPVTQSIKELSIDEVIYRVTGGKRDDIYIVWKLDDGFNYKYDIFSHKLTREKHDAC